MAAVLAHRASDQNWADSVAGDMERHYSPGRTWEALARTALPLLETGDVLDIASGDGVLAELVAPHSKRYICIDTSARVVAAASERGGCPMWKCARATCMPCRSGCQLPWSC